MANFFAYDQWRITSTVQVSSLYIQFAYLFVHEIILTALSQSPTYYLAFIITSAWLRLQLRQRLE